MTGVHLVMPMAGRGSRFDRAGFGLPKPLIPLAGRPFLAWAADSVRETMPVASMTFVVLAEHVDRHGIDRVIRGLYPRASLVVLPETTAGALVTAVAGCRDLPASGPVLVNDCDHAFRAPGLDLDGLLRDGAGFLCHFRSRNPAFSYAEYGADGRLCRTVEKQPVSDLAIAGAYGFANRDTLLRHVDAYQDACPYDEPFMSGIYNTMVAAGCSVRGVVLDGHLSFGTPPELSAAEALLDRGDHWLRQEALA